MILRAYTHLFNNIVIFSYNSNWCPVITTFYEKKSV